MPIIKNRTVNLIIDYILIACGTFITALALCLFLVPLNIPSGGVSTLGMFLLHYFDFPLSISNFIFNAPLFCFNTYIFGFKSGVKTLWGILSLSLSLQLCASLEPFTDNIMLACIYGGVLAGIGMGLVFRCGGTTGGTDLAANIVNHYFGMSIGTSLAAIDALIMGLAFLIFGPEPTMFGLITVFVTGKIIDIFTEGLNTTRAVLIISDQSEAIGQAIDTQLDRGLTFLRGAGYFKRLEHNIILSALRREEIGDLKDIVYEIDAKAFVIVLEAHEVLGAGFKQRTRL